MGDRATILFVDDEASILEIFESLMEDEGYRVLTSLDPSTVLAMPELPQVDAIFSDIRMIPMDGIQFLRELRRAGINTPVIFITGHASSAIVKMAHEMGVIDLIEKPFNPEVLKEISTRVIELGHRLKETQRLLDMAQIRSLTPSELEQLETNQQAIDRLKQASDYKKSA